jgi:hypothetical protein
MKVAFLHANQDPKYALIMLRELKKSMPAAEVIQLTDMETPAIEGCKVSRMKWEHPNPMIFKMEHLALIKEEALIIDTDVVVQCDLSPVFLFPFDIGLTWRNRPILDPDGEDITKLMPYNCGVMFHRNPAFWDACLQWCIGKNPGWFADQISVAIVSPRFNVLKLHCDNFNYTPRRITDDVSMKFAVHYKGKRRHLMDERFG